MLLKRCSKCEENKAHDNFRSVKPGKGDKFNLHSWCRECTRVARREHYQKNKQKYREWERQHRENNPEYYQAVNRGRREYLRVYQNEARARNPEQYRAYDHNYRALKMNAEGVLSKAVIEDVFRRWGRKCLRCDSTKNIEIDHVVALSNGGSNLIENLQPLCKSCNSSKGNRHSVDYRTQGEGRAAE